MNILATIWRTMVASTFLLAGSLSAGKAGISIDVGKPGVKVSPLLYGIFFEEINRAGDGGLYGEMVQNRSFEDAPQPNAWTLIREAETDAAMALDTSMPLSAENPTSLRIEIKNAAGVANEGFRGIAVRKGGEYSFSLYARCQGESAPGLKVTIERADSIVLAEKTIVGVTTEWACYTGVLTASEAETAARLVITVTKPCTLWLDMVSLFPKDTFKNRPNGLRPDLAAMLVHMQPAFVRFPGGCFVEGDRMENATRWKKTIGDPISRPGHWNLWGYRSTDGLGYHEYLQLSEDLGAEPMFVFNCGMAHGGVVPMDKMAEFVQDALDAIEYANGPVTSIWGALRAKAGHPAPFNLKYMEIGNENGGAAYHERYALCYKAIKGRYPQMNLIANVSVPEAPMEILDEHYYNSPEFFMNEGVKYDAYDRKGPKIYVGEYAVTQNAGKGNLGAALGEAAFMTALERNADQVVMASYAPLFVNNNWRQWNPDAIVFDSARVYGTPSYHVQAMFGRNRADVVLPVEISEPPVTVEAVPGAIGVGTWMTQAEYKDIVVTKDGATLFKSDFSKGMDGWKTRGGSWTVVDGALRQTGLGENIVACAGDATWTDYTLSMKARKLGGHEGFLVLFQQGGSGAKNWWNIGGWGNSRHAVEVSGFKGSSVDGSVVTGRWYDVRVELKGASIKCYLDNTLVNQGSRTSVKALYAVAGMRPDTKEIILKMVNTSANQIEAEINIRGGAASLDGTATTLASKSPADENSFEEPNKVAPVATLLTGVKPSFTRVLPPYSVTILRLSDTHLL